MKDLTEVINEAFREVQSQQVIDVDKIGSVKPQNIPAALPSMYAFLYQLSDYYNGPTEYYADDDTLDIFNMYFEKNPDYKFIINPEVLKTGVDFYVKSIREKFGFKVLLTSDEVRIEDWACIIPYKDDGKIVFLNNKNIDYLVWKVPNRNDFYLFNRENLLKYLETADINDNLIRIQKVKGKKDTSVFRISKSALRNLVATAGTDVVTRLTLRTKDRVYIGKDLEEYLEELKKNIGLAR